MDFNGGIVGWKSARGVNDQEWETMWNYYFNTTLISYLMDFYGLYYKNSWTFYAYNPRQTLPSSNKAS